MILGKHSPMFITSPVLVKVSWLADWNRKRKKNQNLKQWVEFSICWTAAVSLLIFITTIILAFFSSFLFCAESIKLYRIKYTKWCRLYRSSFTQAMINISMLKVVMKMQSPCCFPSFHWPEWNSTELLEMNRNDWFYVPTHDHKNVSFFENWINRIWWSISISMINFQSKSCGKGLHLDVLG